MTVRAINHAIVSRYPAAWRERYEAEVLGLIDDVDVRIRDLGELLHGLFNERAREYVSSDDNPSRTARKLALATPIAGAVFVGAAWLVSYGVRAVTGIWSDPAQYAALFVFCVLGVVIGVITYRGKRRGVVKRLLVVPPDVAVLLLPLVFIDIVIFAFFTGAADAYRSSEFSFWFTRLYNALWMAVFAGGLISSFWPGKELLEAFAELAFAERQLQANETWAASCREWNARGVPSPLDDALVQIGKWTLERDSARERLSKLGYRARFRGPTDHVDHSEPRS